MEALINLKKRIVNIEADFKEMTDEYFTLYYYFLRPLINRLQKVVFLNNIK